MRKKKNFLLRDDENCFPERRMALYLHLGQDVIVRKKDIIGIFVFVNASLSKHTKQFLAQATKEGQVCNVTYEMPKSFIVCEEKGRTTVYISQISSRTLLKRATEFAV